MGYPADERAGHRQKIVSVQNPVRQGGPLRLRPKRRHLRGHRHHQIRQGRLKSSFFDLRKQGDERTVPGVQDRIRRDQDREIVRVEVIKDIRETVALHPLADYEPIRLKDSKFRRTEPEIIQALIVPTVGRIPDSRVHVEPIPKLRGGRIERNLRQVFVRRRVDRDEIRQWQLAERLQFPLELRVIPINGRAIVVPVSIEFDLGNCPVEGLIARRRHRHPQPFVGYPLASDDRSSHRLPVHQIRTALNGVFRIHHTDRQRHPGMDAHLRMRAGLLQLQRDLIDTPASRRGEPDRERHENREESRQFHKIFFCRNKYRPWFLNVKQGYARRHGRSFRLGEEADARGSHGNWRGAGQLKLSWTTSDFRRSCPDRTRRCSCPSQRFPGRFCCRRAVLGA